MPRHTSTGGENIIEIDNNTNVVSVKFIEVDTGFEIELFERKKGSGGISHCSFLDVFRTGKYEVQLRLAWDKIQNGQPMLKADIYEIVNSRRVKLDLDKFPHWTPMEKEEDGLKVYTWEFNNVKLRLKTQKTMAKTFTMDAIIVMKVAKKEES